MSLHQKLLGMPFVYNHVRPLVVGGIDMGPIYRRLEATSGATVLDIGCGTGNALEYLDSFERYVGMDTDPIAIQAAQQRYGGRPGVTFSSRPCTEADVEALQPTHVVMAGLLHHLSDADAKQVLALPLKSSRFRRLVTQDIVYLDGAEHWVSNFFARLDRGRFCRRVEGYRALAEAAGLKIVSDALLWSHPNSRRAKYYVLTLER